MSILETFLSNRAILLEENAYLPREKNSKLAGDSRVRERQERCGVFWC